MHPKPLAGAGGAQGCRRGRFMPALRASQVTLGVTAMAFRIDVVSDVVCPWCFIGKRRLERALELLAEDGVQRSDIEIVWRPFQLNPQLPLTGISRAQYVAQK